MTTRFRTAEDVQRLFDAQIPESTPLEYKRALELVNQGQRLEALKDLTGMANGGGGTVLYGVAETSGEHPVPEELCPLEDLRIVGILEDVVRSAVRPPLLVDYGRIPVEGGFVLAMDLEPSPLGPHMIEAYGEARYYQRTLTRTAPMSEQQVRDAYALAVRGRERRPELWAERELPMPAPSTTPWLAVSALPEEPLREIFDVTSVDPSDLRPPEPIASHMGLTTSSVLQRLARWAQGYFGEEHSSDSQATEIVRIHRDGSAAIGTQMPARVTGLFLARKLNGVLAYLAWLWREFGLRRPVEIETTLWNIGSLMLNRASLFGEDRNVQEPVGVPIHKASARDGFVVSDLQRASVRHRAVQKFVDIVYQSFGLPFCEPLFRSGQLYGSAGRPLGFQGS